MPDGHYQPTPAQIISWLPKDATPEQQDSAVQAHSKPKVIHWSERPDTLHLPGQPVGKSVLSTDLPIYYKENFFSGKSCFYTETPAKRQGVEGDPMPYSVENDNFMVSVLLVCLIGTALAISASAGFFSRQLKALFAPGQQTTSGFTETSTEIYIQLALAFEACILLALLFISYLSDYVADTFTIGQYEMTALFTGVFAAFFVVKAALQSVVGWIFFSSEKRRQWRACSLFLTSTLGLLLLPMVLIRSFFNVETEFSVVYTLMAVGLYELLSIYQAYRIFFLQRVMIPGFILYLCTLEIVPLSLTWATVIRISEFLQINF